MKISNVDTTPLNQGQTKKTAAASSDFGQYLNKAMGKNSRLDDIFQAAGQQYNISPTLLKSVAQAESSLNPNAVSRCGAQGIMQLMPSTARSLGVQNSFDPVQNIFGGARYLRQMLDRFGNNVPLALAAYNAGPGAVAKYQGVPPYAETISYVNKIMGAGQTVIQAPARSSAAASTATEAAESIAQRLPDKIVKNNPEIASIIAEITDTERQATLLRLFQLLDETNDKENMLGTML
jgi:SLT domain-containing protein